MNMECENRMLYRTIAGADPAVGAQGLGAFEKKTKKQTI
jgi:hypothetical protein